MLTTYIQAALHQARYEILPDDGSFYGHVPGLDGVWANATSLEGCRDELEQVLEEWILLRVSMNLAIPAIGDVTLTFPKAS